MSRITLRDRLHRVVGYIDTLPDGRVSGRDRMFRLVGHYDPRTDTTSDKLHRRVASGNTLAALIFSAA
jgi:hypothetical protein